MRTPKEQHASGSLGPKTADEIGEDALKEMVAVGTMVARIDPRLPPNSKIPYPHNQQVAHVREKWSNMTETIETESEVVRNDDEATKAAFQEKLKTTKERKNASTSCDCIFLHMY